MNKIINHGYISPVWILFFLTAPLNNHAQDTIYNRYGLQVISSQTVYAALCSKDADKKMADLKKVVPGLLFDLRYAGVNNFMKARLYPKLTTTFLRQPVALALARAQRDLNSKGLSLKIFDGYRPYSATEQMWELVKDDRYAADPRNGSGHNRGIAVDLTIVELQSGKPLNMGTDFDNFTDSAHHVFTLLPKEVLQNRLLLRSTMEKHGFKALETEWWHYSFLNGAKYELLDVSFNQLAKHEK